MTKINYSRKTIHNDMEIMAVLLLALILTAITWYVGFTTIKIFRGPSFPLWLMVIFFVYIAILMNLFNISRVTNEQNKATN